MFGAYLEADGSREGGKMGNREGKRRGFRKPEVISSHHHWKRENRQDKMEGSDGVLK